jgi:hypothetical protein
MGEAWRPQGTNGILRPTVKNGTGGQRLGDRPLPLLWTSPAASCYRLLAGTFLRPDRLDEQIKRRAENA